jgi:predicted regulator of Ras-like GTPase activity (Roadblock/LC7/MglB family)
MAITVRDTFAGLLRGILRHMDAAEAPAAKRPVVATTPPLPVGSPAPTLMAAGVFRPPKENEIAVPLAPIVAALPPQLRAKIMAVPPPDYTINLPLETVTSQLRFGAVKISFGELRSLAANFFANSGGEHDVKIISLPLNEIVPRINPALFSRRTAAKVAVGDGIKGPFADDHAGITFTTQSLKLPVPSKPLPREERPAVLEESPVPSAPIAFRPPPKQAAPAPAPLSPPPLRSTAPIPMASAAPRFAPMPVPPAPKISAAPVTPPVAPAPAPAMPRPTPVTPMIPTSLWDLAEGWPEELREEISRTALANVSVPLPGTEVEAGLKRGRLTMTWRQLRTLAKPGSAPSASDHLELELPLKVITPLFFAAQKSVAGARKTVKVSADIPNLFFGFPQVAPEAPASAPAAVERKAADSNFYVWGDESETPKVAPQTDFMSRQAQPKEVVARGLALPGVAGVVVALPDGLNVASQVPAEFNADTLAAFIPQIFERMNQSAKELRMGALNNVSFTVGNVPWRIFRVNSVLLAAFGRAGEALPAAELSKLASELDRKKPQ